MPSYRSPVLLGSTEEIIMRAFAACLSVVLGLGAFSVVACSSDATTTAAGGGAGEAGAAPSAGSGGKTSSGGAPGAAGAAGAAGEAGAPASTCTFDQPACGACLQTKCGPELGACIMDNACTAALQTLTGCACNPSKTIDQCKTSFGMDGGDPAAPLVTCYDANCASSCE
jgi:hypothetical protein